MQGCDRIGAYCHSPAHDGAVFPGMGAMEDGELAGI